MDMVLADSENFNSYMHVSAKVAFAHIVKCKGNLGCVVINTTGYKARQSQRAGYDLFVCVC